MNGPPLLDRALLLRAFGLLAGRLQRRGVVGELHIFGGAAMVLAFPARVATRDVDALFAPDGPVIEAAAEVARELGLPRSWLNDQASTYVSSSARAIGARIFDHRHLRVAVTPPDHLLAMKVRAARPGRDADDIRLLLEHLGLTQIGEVEEVVERYFPGEPLGTRSRLLLDDILGAGPSGQPGAVSRR